METENEIGVFLGDGEVEVGVVSSRHQTLEQTKRSNEFPKVGGASL